MYQQWFLCKNVSNFIFIELDQWISWKRHKVFEVIEDWLSVRFSNLFRKICWISSFILKFRGVKLLKQNKDIKRIRIYMEKFWETKQPLNLNFPRKTFSINARRLRVTFCNNQTLKKFWPHIPKNPVLQVILNFWIWKK
jgi:hypothetical protein